MFGYSRVSAQTSVTSSPVGVIPVLVAAASSGQPSLTVIANPFEGGVLLSGSVASVDAPDTLSIAGGGMVAGSFSSTPCLLRIRPGGSASRAIPIASNSATQIVLKTGGMTLVSGAGSIPSQIGVGGGDRFEVVRAWTLGSLFGVGTLASGASASLADNVLILEGGVWATYFFDGTAWRKNGSAADQGNLLISPETAVMVRRRGGGGATVYLSGQVPRQGEGIWLGVDTERVFANRFPLDVPLSSLGLHSATGWQTGSHAGVADCVRVWNGSTWDLYFHNGLNWRRAGSLQNQDSKAIPAGSGAMILRRSPAGNAINLSLPLPYSL